jgi:hypothetical protein
MTTASKGLQTSATNKATTSCKSRLFHDGLLENDGLSPTHVEIGSGGMAAKTHACPCS